MITLNLPLNIEQAISQQARQSGLSVEHYLIQQISALANTPNDVAQFVQGKRLESFPADTVQFQQAMRDE